MTTIKDLENNILYLIDNNEKVLETGYIGAEFVITIYIDKPIIITEKVDKCLYGNLLKIMNNEYIFNNNGLSYKIKNEIRWFSDQGCNIENEEETNRIDRIVIKKLDNVIQVVCENPYYEKKGIKKSQSVIAFSPAGNGFYSRNLATDNTFQTDFIIAVYDSIAGKYPKNKIYIKK